ncbi:4-hydroxythreonine-4-phosphate dehydrogenase [Rubripirellula tenax]|uniref:4-hydroxythreonine-4-phosphate dehydrogenase n=1 Tax=Rubripirellula tenax TaxID=2528015 RepID=A0A5C6FG47_9BACT|nr:4-hydroxythreonine-4-phosphate dehydrogenase PdxA [Rubripirellula tenax]TWU60756.1 4-hydroxythreonine-4-phosphate dehydrogenase [Rubripirellula tenax]
MPQELDSHSERRPRIAISVGDVAGVGPELAIQCAQMPAVTQRCQPILYGPQNVLVRAADHLGIALTAEIHDVGELDAASVVPGQFNAATGRTSFEAFDKAITDAIRGDVAGIVTGPIQKEAWHAAGIRFPGHTEVLADRTGIADACMMLTSNIISCVLVTVHIPLADVAEALSTESILRAIHLGASALGRREKRPARVTVCGLNPHAGENGLISHGEETAMIIPAIESARAAGIAVTGPLPPDTAFTPSNRDRTDVYVCMYHDQGLIPLKALAFDDAVNVTLGLPIVRTSVDHGTAMDIAWQGKVNRTSMLAAIDMAIDLSDG